MPFRYRGEFAGDRFDTIVVGSGMGGLATARLLAGAGQRVLVLERHYEPGGFLHTFKRKGWEWDVGVHYIGMVHRPRSAERRLFDALTGGRLEWAAMGSPYDVAVIDGDRYDFVGGPKEQVARWKAYFPEEAEAIDAYWERVRAVQAQSARFFSERAMPPLIAGALRPWLTRGFQQWAQRTTWEVLRALTDNTRLIEVLCAQSGDYGLSPKESSFAMHAIVVGHYRHGGAYPVGGARRIHESLTAEIEARGGAVALHAPVARIVLEGERACGIELEDGERIHARRVVSATGVHNTFFGLLPPDYRWPFALEADLNRVARSHGHLCLYVGLDASDVALAMPKNNYWVFDSPGAPGERIVDGYLSFPSAKDPAWPDAHPDKATVQCIGLGNYADVEAFAGTNWRKRPEAYTELKDRFAEQMLDRLYAVAPQTRGHVAYTEVSTPLSTQRFANYDRGQIYGLAHTPERFALRWLRPRTPIRNLWLTGQDIVSAGVGGAMMSGFVTASAMLGRNMIQATLREGAPAA